MREERALVLADEAGILGVAVGRGVDLAVVTHAAFGNQTERP
jgi:hypothetical protein